METSRQMVFPQFAPGRAAAPEGDNHAPRAAEAVRGAPRRAGGADSGTAAGKGRTIAIVYREEDDGHGNLTLRKITTARYVTVPWIADALGVTDQAIYNRVSAGEFDGGPQPVARLGVAIRIPVDTFLWWKERFFDNAEYERPPKEN